ncbi:MAG: type II toxin-antitoxin system VapC family toxin [Nitrospirae bacterium]|jgi:predicted nucleic acid-binding protein|nr:type II toxin-antitoxin system VapC family toxin [Nitrospirota bacterium]
MKRVLMDTNTYTAFKKNDPAAVNVFRTVEYIGVNIVVLGELLSGFKGGNKEARNRKELEQFLDSPRVNIIQVDEETAEFYARIYWDLKKKGKPVPSNDLWVASSAMRHGLALFTYDEHFDNIDGLILHKEDL